MLCPECQSETEEGKSYCDQCGAELLSMQDTAPQIVETVAETAVATEQSPAVVQQRQRPITIHIDGATDRGLVRERNEDTFGWFSYKFPNHPIEVVVAIVSDGMGGGQQGDRMANMSTNVTKGYIDYMLGIMLPVETCAADAPADELFQTLNIMIPNIIHDAVQHANEKIREYAKQQAFERGDYGATIVAIIVIARCDIGEISIHGWNEGDARGSWYDGESITQLTRDHAHGDRITKCLGLSQKISGDSFSKDFLISERGCFMAYTDGLYKMVEPNPQLTVAENIEAAKTVATPVVNINDPEAQAEPGDDNITLVKIDFVPVVRQEKKLAPIVDMESEEILDLVTTLDSKKPQGFIEETESQEILDVVTKPEEKKSKWWKPSRFLKPKQ